MGRGCGSRGDTELGLGSGRLCRTSEGAADSVYRTAGGSLLSTGTGPGTCCF